MNKSNPRCDVHMYPKKINCRIFVFVTIIFEGYNVFSPINFCLFQIYSKFSHQVLYVELDQFAKVN